MKFIVNLFAALCASLILSACGGGGGSSSTSGSGSDTGAAPPPTPTAQASISASATSVSAGQPVTLTWSSQNSGVSNCQASGAWSGQVATSGSQQVTTASNTAGTGNYAATYTITCGSANASVSVSVTPPAVQNSVQLVVDNGPAAANGSINIPFVSVTVCRPGTSVCQTIDHVMVDSGSFGLRLVAPLDSALTLPSVKTAAGATVAECGQFVSGYTWGSVLQADIKLGGEVASSQSIQVIGDTSGGIGSAPSSCSSIGGNLGTVSALGAKGVLGIGLFKQDCGAACVNTAITATYYACSNGSCAPTAMPLAQQVSNPVAAFATDNNGLSISFPAVGTGGSTPLTGTLTFGIGTQSNNGLGGATRYAANSSGHFRTVYKSATLTGSYIDSGSNGIYFNDSALAKCSLSKDFYCPASPASLSATITAYDGSASATIAFTIESVDGLPNSAVAGWIGGPSGSSQTSSSTFDWGMPFFFGRKVYIGLESDTANPYWAF
jgi:hypothetical protein